MTKKIAFICLLLLCCAGCVSRTITAPDPLTGSNRQVIKDKKLIWFWQDEF